MPRETIVVHRHDPRNIGDMSCAPSSYLEAFPWLANATTIDIETQIGDFADRLPEANVIYGGGGLLGTGFFDAQLAQLMKLGPHKLICWGAGHNNHDTRTIVMPSYMERFDLVGVRDSGTGYPWLPCVSAMIPSLGNVRIPTAQTVIYRHWDDNFAGLLVNDYGCPVMRNNEQDLEAVLNFLGSGETVVTNSYHGAYWALLMGRKVAIVSPFSSKFFGFRWNVPIITDGNWYDVSRSVALSTYPAALNECRSLNRLFGNEVHDLLRFS